MRSLVVLFMCAASPLLIQAQSALFPATRSDVARGVPTLASATCRDDYTSVTGAVYTCNAACPFGSTGERENDGLSSVAQVSERRKTAEEKVTERAPPVFPPSLLDPPR
jgi:hypothetical protein